MTFIKQIILNWYVQNNYGYISAVVCWYNLKVKIIAIIKVMNSAMGKTTQINCSAPAKLAKIAASGKTKTTNLSIEITNDCTPPPIA